MTLSASIIIIIIALAGWIAREHRKHFASDLRATIVYWIYTDNEDPDANDEERKK